ncbi:MAG: 16S rRNA (cytosine(1402)-N(4))-methyltransferase RsmH [Lachnospiraceae bacterium]|nr:16S rRNA (cytosine(1402)-N(4))-methyltransferase RsmH [Lachnospiraceae bacterium]
MSNLGEEARKYKRRVRYKGTHPRRYEEKYKELNPEKYREDIQKILQKGKTPAGMHIPICVREILDFLQIQPGQIGLDATLGYGGHTQKLLECLKGEGHLYAIDVDTIELEKTKKRLEELGYGSDILTIQHRNFAEIDQIAPEEKFDFVLADLGVSSMQIDNPKRGFTFKHEGALDLRLDVSAGITAAQRLRELNEEELAGMLVENADEPYAEQIAKAVRLAFQSGETIDTTRQFVDVIERALSFVPENERKEAVKKSSQRTFQALRIDINGEFEVLYEFLEKLPDVLKSGGRAAILTFHFGEDRLVKKAFRQGMREGIYSDAAKDVIRPSAEECFQNPRARSTKMRWAIRT